jgi:hypothetical protein
MSRHDPRDSNARSPVHLPLRSRLATIRLGLSIGLPVQPIHPFVRHFARSSRWRQVFFAACLPYVVVSVFVESLHTGQARQGDATAPAAIVVTDGASRTQAAGALVLAAGSEESCPACNWLRLGRRIESPVGLVRTQDIVLADTPPLIADWPASPVPHPALFRGPPRSVLS